MADAPFLRPDVLVLASGGTLGEAWMSGILAGIEDATGHDFRATESVVGTSAGSLVGAALVAGERPRRPRPPDGQRELTAGDTSADVASEGSKRLAAQWPALPRTILQTVARDAVRLAGAAATPLAPMALAAGSNGSTVLRAALLGRAPGRDTSLTAIRERVDKAGARFDGRLRVVAVDRKRGRRVVFGSPRAPRASVEDAVLASCSVPWIFAPVEIDGREYVDGGVWSLSNLDVAPVGRGGQVLAFLPTVGTGGRGPMAIMRAAAQAAALAELQVLRARGASVRIIAPDAATLEAMGPNLMDGRLRAKVRAAGHRHGLRLAG